jgi:hypothetical protein
MIKLARELGHEKHIQPVGHLKNRGLNYVWSKTARASLTNKFICFHNNLE